MKCIHKITAFLLCAVLLIVPITAFAEEPYDPYEDPETEWETIQTTTTAPATTAHHGTLTPETTTVTTTTEAPKPVDPPLVKITRENMTRRPKVGETFTVSVIFHNYSGTVALRSGLASFEPSEGLVLAENSASKVVPVIEANGVRTVQIKVRVTKNATTANQSLSVTYTYSYKAPEGLQQAETTEKLLVTVVPVSSSEEKSSVAAAKPNIIVSGYDFGGRITAGDTFSLKLQFRNTSTKLTAENIVMSVEVGEGISITSASNSYYYASLAAGQTRSQSIPMRVAANADPEGARIDISFHYEFVDQGVRSDASASEKLSIPIFIPDRFSISEPDTDLIGMQNEELSLSLPYVNKSRVSVSNVSAQLLFDETAVSCEQPHLNLGNIEPGKSGSIDLFFTPIEAGNGSVTVQITYEDEMTQEKKLEIKVPYSADEAYFDPGMEEPIDIPEEKTGMPAWLLILIIAAAVVVVVVVIIIIVRKRKKKKALEPLVDFDWSAPQEVEPHEDR